MTRRNLLLIVFVVLAAAVVFAHVRAGRPRVVARGEGASVSVPASDGRFLLWLETDDGEARLVSLGRFPRRTHAVFTSSHLSGLAVADGAAFVTRALHSEGEERGAELLRIDLKDGAVEVLSPLPRAAEQIVCGDGFLCWREYRDSSLPAVPFVVAAAPLHVLRVCSETPGEVTTAAVLPAEPQGARDDVELVGIADGRVYWVERATKGGAAQTAIRHTVPPDGQPQTLTEEPGRRSAVLLDGSLLWTAPSEECPEQAVLASVKRLPLGETDAEIIADWLNAEAGLLASSGQAWVQERHRLWRLGLQRGQQRVQATGPPGIVDTCVLGGEQYLVLRRGTEVVLARRPLTWSARLLRSLTP